MKLALYQGESPAGNVEDAFTRIRSMLTAASAAGAEMLVFPELFLPGYNQPVLHHSHAQPIGGAWEQQLSKLARDASCGITIGWAESESGRIFNVASTIDSQGRKIAHYRKIQLFGAMENANFSPGDAYTVFNLNGRRTALLICYDVEFSQHCWELKRMGVELLLVPTANPKSYEHVSRVLVPARASECNMTIAYANYCGAESGLIYAGMSLVVGPDARPLAKAGTGETLLVADLDTVNAIDPAIISTQRTDYRKLGAQNEPV